MRRLTFPDDIFPGLVFNDFIDNDPLIVHKYAPYAVHCVQDAHSSTLYMDHETMEILHIDHRQLIPQRLIYITSNSVVIAKLNRVISENMNCYLQGEATNFYEHPLGLTIDVMSGYNGCTMYFLLRRKELSVSQVESKP